MTDRAFMEMLLVHDPWERREGATTPGPTATQHGEFYQPSSAVADASNSSELQRQLIEAQELIAELKL